MVLPCTKSNRLRRLRVRMFFGHCCNPPKCICFILYKLFYCAIKRFENICFYKQDPPLTSINCPVTQRLSGEARNAAVSAMSSTSPKRLKAEIVVAYCFIIGSLKSSAFISVLINPGSIAFTVIPRAPSCFASVKVVVLIAPFVILYATKSGKEMRVAADEILIIRLLSRKRGSAS